MNAPRFDCHFHTTKSDGLYTPEEAVKEAISQKLEFAACTNHDLIDTEIVAAFRDAGIDSVQAVEISACDYEASEGGKNKSLHVTAYAKKFDADFHAQLAGVRSTRVIKVNGQIKKLAEFGFDIDSEEFSAYWTQKGLGLENLSNGHIRDYLFFSDADRAARNSETYRGIVGELPNLEKFITRHLRTDGEFAFGSHRVPEYEPGYQTLSSVRQRCGAILSIAHPNHTFGKEGLAEFERRTLRAVDSGAINALEIHSSTPLPWIEKILEIKNRCGLILTFGSDCHFKESFDGKHAWLGELNRNVDSETLSVEFEIFRNALENAA